jgi:serine/threonine-protein kinase
MAALDRRRVPPPVVEEEDEEASQSVSLTPATVNNRPSLRTASAFRDEDSVIGEDSHVDTHSDVADLLERDPTHPTSAMHDADDDESTAGYDNTYTETNTPPTARSRRPSVLLVAIVALLLVIAAGAAWLFVLEPMLKPARPTPVEASLDAAPSGQEPHAAPAAGDPAAVEPTGATGVAPPAASDTGSAAPSADTGTPTTASPQGTGATDAAPPAEGTGQGSGAPAVAAGTAAEQAGTDPEPKSATPPPAPTPPAKVSVQFKAPTGTTMKVGGRSVKPNASLSLLPGTIRVDYRCRGSRAKGSKEFEVPTDPSDPIVFRLDCRQKSRR